MKGLSLCAEPSVDVPVKSEVSTSAKSCSFEERMKGMSQGHWLKKQNFFLLGVLFLNNTVGLTEVPSNIF